MALPYSEIWISAGYYGYDLLVLKDIAPDCSALEMCGLPYYLWGESGSPAKSRVPYLVNNPRGDDITIFLHAD